MKRIVVLSVHNRAIYLDQTQAIMWERCGAKSFICVCDILHVQILLPVCM